MNYIHRPLNGVERKLKESAEASQKAIEAICSGRTRDAERYSGQAEMARIAARLMSE